MSSLCRESVRSKGPGVTVRTESDGSHPLQIGILPKRPVLLSVHGAQKQREAIRVHRRSAQRGRFLRALPADGGSRDRPACAATRGPSGLASLSAAVVIPERRKHLSGIVRHRHASFFYDPGSRFDCRDDKKRSERRPPSVSITTFQLRQRGPALARVDEVRVARAELRRVPASSARPWKRSPSPKFNAEAGADAVVASLS